MTLRRTRRAVALLFSILTCIVRFWLLGLSGPRTLERRALWVQASARHMLKSLGIEYTVEGVPPTHGLVVSNHLSYIDILIFSAAMPCFFVAKMEIVGWPFFGKAARSGGTIFVDRSSLASALTVAEQMTERLKLPIPIPFHSRLIDPATSLGVPITTACVRYVLHDGMEERELCWYGDETFVNHLWKVLGVTGYVAEVQFGEPRVYTDRRVAADETHDEISAMRERQGPRDQGTEGIRSELVES